VATEKLKPSQVAEALTRARGLISIAARSLRCSDSTVRNYIDRHEVCRQAVEHARGLLVDVAEARLGMAVERGEPWAVTFCLRTLGRERGYVHQIEQVVTAAPAERITLDHLSTEQMREIITLVRGPAGLYRLPKEGDGSGEPHAHEDGR
jgi:hypothetical protein